MELDSVVGAKVELNVLVRISLVMLDKLLDSDADVDAVVELVDEATGQLWTLTWLESSVTDPPRPNNPPFTTAAVSAVIEIPARKLPWNKLPVPKVADVPTCQ